MFNAWDWLGWVLVQSHKPTANLVFPGRRDLKRARFEEATMHNIRSRPFYLFLWLLLALAWPGGPFRMSVQDVSYRKMTRPVQRICRS